MTEEAKIIIKILKKLDLYDLVTMFPSIELFEHYCSNLLLANDTSQKLTDFFNGNKSYLISGVFIWPAKYHKEYSDLNNKWRRFVNINKIK